jgi:hypothetical protein
VSPGEWAKYGATPIDMTGSRRLLADLVHDAERLGVRALDATDALAGAEPGAFLDKDIHMSAKGHAALAEALAVTLAAPEPRVTPGPGLPRGRSRVPTLAELELVPSTLVPGADEAHCSTRPLREWVYVECTPDWRGALALREVDGWTETERLGEPSRPVGVSVIAGEEAMVGGGRETTRLLMPVGRDVDAVFLWSDGTRRRFTLTGTVAAFSPATDAPPPTPAPACAKRDADWLGDVARGCLASYPDDCAAQLDCAAGTRGHLPTCPEGQVNAGSAGHCHDVCPCEDGGACAEWQGARVCL